MSENLRGGDQLHPYAVGDSCVGGKFIFACVSLLFFLLIFAIASHSAEKKSMPALTMKQIANATLFINTGGEGKKQKIKLKNGHFERRKKGSDTLLVDLTTWVKFTDLDKDGSQDAAVIFVWNKGGEEIFYELAALLNKKGKPLQVSSADLGDRVVIQALDVSADTVFLNMLTRGKGDENCCPTVPTKVRYNFQAGKLMEQKKVSPLTLEELKNATYVECFNGEDTVFVKLEDGKFEQSEWPPEKPEYPAMMYFKDCKFGDLNSDGIEDAAVIYVWSGGGSGWFYELAAILNEDGKPVHLVSEPLGDRVKIESLEVDSGEIKLSIVTHGPHDGACCPTLPVKLRYRLQEGKLVEQTNYIGVYQGKSTQKNGVSMNIKMSVNSDTTVNMTIKYSDGSPTENKKGKWYIGEGGSLFVRFTEGDYLPSGDDIIFRFLNNKLTSMGHYERIYGEGNLEFERVNQ